jgi:acyl-CoA synthetase (AMP-forming)/AMP-acid ligase II
VVASLCAGAHTFARVGCNALRFFHWLDEERPTWATGVPTMYRAILARADRNRQILARRRLRFIRSSSAQLRPALMAQLEKTFEAPVIEAYGMTEAAHQIASNPLPPRVRKPGSVGIASGPQVAIMDAEGNLVAAGATGEIVVRGANVTSGYVNNAEANAAAFHDGWFRTGDQGTLDVDVVLHDHPAVQLALAFALPHESLGEEVAAAVVLREGASVTERELRDYAERRLAHYKVPHKIVFVTELPRGPTGKLQRIGLAARLGLVK